MLPEIIKRALDHTVTNIGQLTKDEIKTLNAYVKKGYLEKSTSYAYPTPKPLYHPSQKYTQEHLK